MNIKYIITIAAATALSACVANESKRSYDKPVRPAPAMTHHQNADYQTQMANKTHMNTTMPNATYDCRNGWTVNTQYFAESANHPNMVTLSIKEISMSVTLPQAVSGSGTRYAGQGLFGANHQTEWHEDGKSGEAVFDFVTTNKKRASTVCTKIA